MGDMTLGIVVTALALLIAVVVVIRTGVLYRWPWFMRRRIEISRRRRGKGTPGTPGMGEGSTDPTAGF